MTLLVILYQRSIKMTEPCETKWAVTQRCIRNDGGYVDEIERFDFDSKEEAIEYIVRDCANDISYDFRYPADKDEIAKELDFEKLKEHLEKEQRIWIWEWRRKGNGDLYVLHKTCDKVNIGMKHLESLNKFKIGYESDTD